MDDATLLSLLMARTMPERDIAQAVATLLAVFGSVASVVAADPPELARAARLDATTITDLKILRRLSVRLARSEACRRPVLSSWSALVAYVRSALAHEPREQFRTLYLDKKNILLRDEFRAEGTVDHAPVYPREVIRRALELSASALMGQIRGAISRNAPVSEVRAEIETLDGLFAEAARALAPDQASNASSFLGAFAVLLREGLEALLIVVAMIAFLRKAERTDVLPYVHGGWVAALLAGGLTWAAATYLITISGASRELTEGFGSLIASVVLISVGLWMHGKAQADAWQVYIREKLSTALSKKSAWFLFLLAFIVVYREVFETILFLTALWTQGGGAAMLAGIGAAALVLVVVTWVMLRLSRSLPIAKFFQYSAILMAALAVVLAGKGVAALQEAGLISLHPLALPRFDWLGFYPTIEGVLAQLLAIAALAFGFIVATRKTKDLT